jgi:hypothetical protein
VWLRDGKQPSTDLGRDVDFRDPDVVAAIRDAEARGWLRMELGGIGGMLACPPTWFEITALGTQQLSE